MIPGGNASSFPTQQVNVQDTCMYPLPSTRDDCRRLKCRILDRCSRSFPRRSVRRLAAYLRMRRNTRRGNKLVPGKESVGPPIECRSKFARGSTPACIYSTCIYRWRGQEGKKKKRKRKKARPQLARRVEYSLSLSLSSGVLLYSGNETQFGQVSTMHVLP